MRKNRDPAQFGCLTLLLLWAALGIYLQVSGAWSAEGSDGGGRFAVIGLFGLIAFVVIFGVKAAVRGVLSRARRGRSRFPVVTKAPPTKREGNE